MVRLVRTAMGSHSLDADPTLEAARSFAAGFRHPRRRHARTRMFLRAEDVFGFVKRIDRETREFEAEGLSSEAAALRAAYGDNPDGRSHGETFLAFLQYRMRAHGLLSARRTGNAAIATHSPILMALPGATIYEVSTEGISAVAWDEVAHVRVTRAFLNNPALSGLRAAARCQFHLVSVTVR